MVTFTLACSRPIAQAPEPPPVAVAETPAAPVRTATERALRVHLTGASRESGLTGVAAVGVTTASISQTGRATSVIDGAARR